MNPKISIFVGHYGSGKTEIALNTAIAEKKRHEQVILIDLDVVNPFYRSSELQEQLTEQQITVLAPNFVKQNIDIPSLPPEVKGAIENETARVIIDVGGDDAGAKVLGVYLDSLRARDIELLFVFNTRRPMTNTVDQLVDMIRHIETASRLNVTGLVANTNLGVQ